MGAPKNIGWAILNGDRAETGNNLDEFIQLFGDLAKDKPAALGFEAPLFIPLNDKLENLTKQRNGENGRPWSAGAGATVTTISLAITTYTLSNLRQLMPDSIAILDWKDWPASNNLLIFEAFVSGSNHAGPGEHWKDALNAAIGFREALGDLDAANAIHCENVLSLVGACLIRSGWMSENQDVLEKNCLVIRPD